MQKLIRSPLFWAILEAVSGLIVALFLALLPGISISGALGIVVAFFAFIIAINTMVFSHLRRTHEEEFVHRVEERAFQRYQELSQNLDVICSCLEHLSELSSVESKIDKDLWEYSQIRIEKLIRDLNEMVKGKVKLSKSEYYDEICESIDEMLSGDVIFAINFIDETRWSYETEVADPYQKMYWEANKRALHRGVSINRIFILTSKLTREETITILQEQINQGVKVYAVWNHKQLDDMFKRDLVIFQSKKRCVAYEDFSDPIDMNRVISGIKYVYEDEILKLIQLWKKLKDISEFLTQGEV